MLEQTDNPEVAADDPAIGINLTCTVGNGRQLMLTAGVRLKIEKGELNSLLDKMTGAADRQAMRYELHDREAAIKNMYHQVTVQLDNRDRYARELEASFIDRGKHGEFKPTNDQKSKLATYATNVQGLRDAIFKAEKELEELREQCR